MKNSADFGGFCPLRRSASMDKTLHDLQNSSYPTQSHSAIILLPVTSLSTSESANRTCMLFLQVESHMSDDCVMTMVHCPYEGAGCTFHVSSAMIERFGNHFVFEITNLTCTVRHG